MRDSSVSALLFSNESQSLSTVDRVFNDGGVITDVCLGYESAKETLKSDSFDILAIDLDEPNATPVLALWASTSHPAKVVIAFAMHVETIRQARSRIHFTLQKPLIPALLARTLRAARGTLLQKRRSAPRHAVQIPAKVVVVQNGSRKPVFQETILDLSLGGVCMKTEPAVAMGATVEIEFCAPGSSNIIHAKGLVRWSESTGVAGVKFTYVPPAEMVQLKSWSDNAENLAKTMPANLAASINSSTHGFVRR